MKKHVYPEDFCSSLQILLDQLANHEVAWGPRAMNSLQDLIASCEDSWLRRELCKIQTEKIYDGSWSVENCSNCTYPCLKELEEGDSNATDSSDSRTPCKNQI